MPEDAGVKSSLAKRLLSNAVWAFGAKSIGMTSGLITSALLARLLSTEDMGAYFLVASISAFAALVACFGMRQTIVRLVSESLALGLPGRARGTIKIVFSTIAIGCLLVSSAYVLGVGEWLARELFHLPILASITVATGIWIIVQSFQMPVTEIFRGMHKIRHAVLLDGGLVSFFLATALTAVWIADVKLSLEEAVLISALVSLGVLLLGVGLGLKSFRALTGDGGISTREVLAISFPVFVTNLAAHAMTNSSLWVVAAFLSAREVALFGAAWKLVMLVAVPLELMNMIIQPVIADLYTRGELERLQNALRGTAMLAGLPALTVLVVYMVAGQQILSVVYGETYGQGALLLAILSVGHLVNVWTGSCGQVLVFTGHQQQLMKVFLLTGLFAVLLSLYGAANWGAVGVACTVTIGRVFQNILVWLLVRRLTGLWTHATLRPSFLRFAFDRVRERSGGQIRNATEQSGNRTDEQ
jgi:O-antigen/teichoic acid export membrane protein